MTSIVVLHSNARNGKSINHMYNVQCTYVQCTIWFMQSSAKKEKCKKAYLGDIKRMLKFRLADHCG